MSESETINTNHINYTFVGNILCKWFGHKWQLMDGFPSASGDRIYECGRWNCGGWHG